jgi:hypothetical protein
MSKLLLGSDILSVLFKGKSDQLDTRGRLAHLLEVP